MASYWQIFLVFAKIGAFTLGGGMAMIPLIQNEIVKRGWLSEDDFPDIIALAQIAPGLLAVNISIFAGYKLRGTKGSIVATVGSVMPSFLIILLIAMLFTGYHNHLIEDIAQRMLVFGRKFLCGVKHVHIHKNAERLHQIARQIEGIEIVFVRDAEPGDKPVGHNFAAECRKQHGIAVVERAVDKVFIAALKRETEQRVKIYLCRMAFTVCAVVGRNVFGVFLKQLMLLRAKPPQKISLPFYFKTNYGRPYGAARRFPPTYLSFKASACIMPAV